MSYEALETADRAVAVIGVGAILPDAPNAPQFWENVASARYSIRDVPPERWDPAEYYDPDPKAVGKTYSKIGGWVRDFAFDSMMYRIPPRVASAMDVAQMWGISAAHEALLDAGHPKKPLNAERTAVIVGNAMGGQMHYLTSFGVMAPPSIRKVLRESPTALSLNPSLRASLEHELATGLRDLVPGITEDSMPGELANVVAGRIASAFDLHGPNYVCDAACASSLAALDAAVEGLLSKHFDAVLCGGVDRNMGAATFVKFCKVGALSPDGSRPFAKGANGFVMGEGAAMFVLKRLADAERDEDRIYAVIRAVGGASDGKGKSITAPNPEGQKRSIKRAYERAGFSLATVGQIEAHGTSTIVGDQAEVAALNEMFRGLDLPVRSVALGSIKSQIGHLKASAGAAGLLKAVYALHHKILAPSAQFNVPSPDIRFEDGPLYVNTRAQHWERPANAPRRIGVSAFGFGGTNFHVVLEEHVPGMLTKRRAQVQVPGSSAVGLHFGIGGGYDTATAPPPMLRGLVMAYGNTLAKVREQLVKLAQDASNGITPPWRLPLAEAMNAPQRVAIDFGSAEELEARAKKAIECVDDDRPAAWRLARGKSIFRGYPAPGKIAFLFPGQGSQYVNMLRELRDVSSTVRLVFDEADGVMRGRLDGRVLTRLIFVDTDDKKRLEEAEEALRHTTVTQPAMLAANIALARLLRDYGIAPDMVMGHSLGEYAALVSAGVMPFADALIAVSARAREMANVSLEDSGQMAGVIGEYEKIPPILKKVNGYVVAANRNSHRQTVIAGGTKAMDEAMEMLRDAGLRVIPLKVSHAFHSNIVAPASEPLRRVVQSLRIQPPSLPVVANVDGKLYPMDLNARDGVIDRLARQIAAPVQFVDGLETLYEAGVRVFVEVGPRKVLASFAEEVLSERGDIVALATNNPKTGAEASFGAALAYLYSIGRGNPGTPDGPEPGGSVRYKPEEPSQGRPPVVPPATAAILKQVQPVPSNERQQSESALKQSTFEAVAKTSSQAPVPPESTRATPTSTQVATRVTPSATDQQGFGGDGYGALPMDTTLQLGRLFASFLQTGIGIYQRGATADWSADASLSVPRVSRDEQGSVVVSGAAVGLPGEGHKLFDDEGVKRILHGEQLIGPVPSKLQQRMVDKNVVRLIKSDSESPRLDLIEDTTDVLHLAGRRGAFNLVDDFGVAEDRADALDVTTAMAIGAGLDALRDAGIPLVRRYRKTSKGTFLPDRWMLPEPLADETGVIFASAFPGYNRFSELLSQYYEHRAALSRVRVLEKAREQMTGKEAAAIDLLIVQEKDRLQQQPYRFSRKFLFEILAMGHSQYAELIGARGPNTQVNSACASTTLAIATAEDWIRSGRCARVLVIAADDVTSDNMLEWIGAGFLATGAATTQTDVSEAALPFDRRRHGMILGMGACALVVESHDAVRARGMRGIAEILATDTANSAFHGTRLDVEHICGVMERIVSAAEHRHGLDRHQMAPNTVFISHETYTPARGGSASAEVHALRSVFGDSASNVVIANTKGFTGHPMGVGIEDALAVSILEHQVVPPIPNFREVDPELGELNLSRGGSYPVQYALRFSAGFGSQVAITLYRRIAGENERTADAALYQRWLNGVSGYERAITEVQHRTLRIQDQGPAKQPIVPTGWTFGQVPRSKVVSAQNTELREYDQAGVSAALASGAAPAVMPVTVPSSSPAPVTMESPSPAAPLVGQPTQVVAVTEQPSEAPKGATSGDGTQDIGAKVIGIVAEKTGYPADMLALDLDLEADLGIDTVKQAEIFAELRMSFGLPRRDDLKLRDYPTLEHVIGYVRDAGGQATQVVESLASSAPAASAEVAQGVTELDPIASKVISIVGDKTGYPTDMLALDLDLEADLGIDTVKQAEVFAELRTAFGLPRRDDLKLRDYPTLEHVISYVRQGATSAGVELERAGASGGADVVTAKQAPAPHLAHAVGASAQPTAVPAAEKTSHVASSTHQAAAGDSISNAVLQIVADKTGYPTDMLEPDLDLEADLGIDTVKQAEIFAVVRDQFEIPRANELKLRDYPTLGHVMGFVRDNIKAQAPVATTAEPTDSVAQVVAQTKQQDADQASEPVDPTLAPRESTHRWVPTPVVRLPIEACKPTGVIIRAEQRIVLVGDTLGAATKLAEILHQKRVKVLHVDNAIAPDALVKSIVDWTGNESIDGVFFLAALDDHESLDAMEERSFRNLMDYHVRALFALAKGLSTHLDRKGTFFVSATRLGGTFGYGNVAARNPCAGPVSGLTKAIGREKPGAVVKVVDFSAQDSLETIAERLVQEVENDPGVVEVGYFDGNRIGVTLVVQDDPAQPSTPFVLDKNSVVVVTGSGGAITSAITADLARQSGGATFHLVDLPAKPTGSDPLVDRILKDREGVKRELIERLTKASSERVTPVVVERELRKIEREAVTREGIRTVEKAGATAVYHSCDVTKTENVKKIIESVVKAHGRIDLIMHAAGLEISRPVESKPIEEFNLVFDVKAIGMFNLLAATRGVKVGAFVSFCSVAGRFGNAGQTDYSAANDFLCKVTSALPHMRQGTRAIAVDWTAWGGIGMATRGSIPEIMKRAGIEMLDPRVGVPLVREELAKGRTGEIVVGGKLGILVEPKDTTGGANPGAAVGQPISVLQEQGKAGGKAEGKTVRKSQKQGQKPDQVDPVFWPFSAVRADPYEGVVLSTTLDPKHPYLNDHRIDGVAVMPGVMGLELFAQAAQALLPGSHVTALCDATFAAPLKCYRDEPREALVTVRLLREQGRDIAVCELHSVQQIKGATQQPEPKLHFSAVLHLATKPAAGSQLGKVQLQTKGPKVSREDLYKAYFHGPAFQVLAGTLLTKDNAQIAGIMQQKMPDLVTPGVVATGDGWLTAPRLLELCFQTAGIIEIGKSRKLGLPSHIEKVQVFEGANELGAKHARVKAQTKGDSMVFEAAVSDEAGRVLMQVNGYHTSALPTPMEEATWKPLNAAIKGLK